MCSEILHLSEIAEKKSTQQQFSDTTTTHLMCRKRWFFFTFDHPLYTQQQSLLLTVSGIKTLAEKISTKEKLCKPHFRREATYRRKPLQTPLQQRSLCKPQVMKQLQTPAEKKEGTESYAKPQNRKKYLSLCTEPQQKSKSRQKALQQTSAENKAQKAKAHGFFCRERSKQKHRSIRKREGHEREREREMCRARERGGGPRERTWSKDSL